MSLKRVSRAGSSRASRSAQPRPGPSSAQKETKKRRRKSKDDIETPSEEAWAHMKTFGSFVIEKVEEPEKYTFFIGDTVAILPTTKSPGDHIEPWEYWVGTIRDVRAKIYEQEGTNDVWAKVKWYFSGSDVAGVVKSFDPDSASSYERIVADDCDLVCPEAFNHVVHVAHFLETDPFQPFIPRYTFYTRYTLEKKMRIVRPKPGSMGCICQKPYDPNDAVIGSLMHFCPRPSCCRAYHHNCLKQHHSKEPKLLNTSAQPSIPRITIPLRKTRSATILEKNQPETSTSRSKSKSPAVGIPLDEYRGSREQTRVLRLLASSPETDDVFSLSSLIPRVIASRRPTTSVSVVLQRPSKKLRISLHTSAPARKATRSTGTTSDTIRPSRKKAAAANGIQSCSSASIQTSRASVEGGDTPTLSSLLDSLPPDLVKIAQQPMVRGGAWWAGGISGNVKAVSEARLLVYRFLQGEPLQDDWKAKLLGSRSADGSALRLSNVIVRVEGGQASLPAFVCPECHSAI